ncbi:MAG: ABC transporter ATP-binding protein/permease [Bacteroidia bacterium]|nr:ABC transporter ATP-binding protein/permease [Bacteroidia bacterium]
MKALWSLNKYFARYWVRLSFGILFVVLSNVFAIYPARVVRYAVDLVVESVNIARTFNGFNLNSEFLEIFSKALIICGILLISMALIKGFFMFLMRQTLIVMSRLIEFDIKNDLYDHYQKLSLSFYKLNSTGDLMNRITEDVSRTRMYIGPAIMYTTNLAATIVIVLYSMFSVNVELSFYALLPLPLMSVLIYWVSQKINKQSEKVQAMLSTISSNVQQAFSGIRIIKAYNRESAYIRYFESDSQAYKKESMQLAYINSLFFPVMMILIGLSTILTVYIGGKQVISGELSLGNIAEFIVYINMLTWPFASIGWVSSIVQRAAASQQRINEFLFTKPEIQNSNFDSLEIQGKIEFNKVSFVYPESGIKALDELSFSVQAGKTLAIIGRTGSGKSTIASLILRLFDASSGEILIDNQNLTKLNLDSLRHQTGYVPQEVFLFSDTIANNIAFGIQDKTNQALIAQAAKDADIYDNISAFPKGFDTIVGERGITLSGGQKQRVSIARAIIRNPKILIFDDCLSAVDTQTEENILANLKKVMQGKTSIIISHRVSSVKDADHILVLDEGRLVEEGDHDSLIALKGSYFELYQKQIRENQSGN